MEINFIYILFLSSISLLISFIGGLVGLVLGVIRLPFILSTGLSVTESIGTNIGVSTLGAITAAIQHIRNKNISFTIFIIMALTGAIGAFYGASLTKNVAAIGFFCSRQVVTSFLNAVRSLGECISHFSPISLKWNEAIHKMTEIYSFAESWV